MFYFYLAAYRSSQSLLESLTSVRTVSKKVSVIVLTFLSIEVYDGLRLRTLPVLYKALQPGTEDDRMKGALWTLNISALGEHPKHGYIWS